LLLHIAIQIVHLATKQKFTQKKNRIFIANIKKYSSLTLSLLREIVHIKRGGICKKNKKNKEIASAYNAKANLLDMC
jgi:hypothetical protein